MRKDRVMLDRLGTLWILSLIPYLSKVIITCISIYMLGLFERFYDCLLFSVSVFAAENLNLLNKMTEMDFPSS